MTPDAAARKVDPPLPGAAITQLREAANEGGTETIPGIDICAFCWDSECDGIVCIAALDPNDSDHHDAIERLHHLLRAGHALLSTPDRGEVA